MTILGRKGPRSPLVAHRKPLSQDEIDAFEGRYSRAKNLREKAILLKELDNRIQAGS